MADLELVAGARGDPGHEELPDAARAQRAHGVYPSVPVVEVADDAHRAGGRRPDRERRSGDALELALLRTESLPELLVAALSDQVHVELAERRRKRVRIVEDERRPVAPGRLQPVVERRLAAWEVGGEEPRAVDLLHLDRSAALREHAHRGCPGTEGAHDEPAALRMDAENAVWIVELARDDLPELPVEDGRLHGSTTRMWACRSPGTSFT